MNSSHAGRNASSRSEPEVPFLDASRFELLEQIGSGGMGTVYRALQRSVGRQVAIKMLAPEHASNATGLARFVREANVVARLTHPNIVQLIDFGRDAEGNLLLVMELLEGEALRNVLRREGRLPPERAVYIAVQVLNALRVAHAAGVIHRDLKPENIFLQRVGEDDHVKVLDFGVAKLTQNDVADQHTTQGSLVGTLRYMAPEQVAGEAPDPRIDLYAVGMMLYELLAGAMPYDTRDRFVLLRQIIAEEPVHLLQRASDIPPSLAATVMRAIAKRPDERFANADEFRRALKPFLAADHARLQALAEVTATRSMGPPPDGAIHSGIVRSEHVRATSSALSGASSVSGSSTSAVSAAGSIPLVAPGYPSAPGYALLPVPPSVPLQPAPAPARSLWVVSVLLLLVALVALIVVGVVIVHRPSPPPPSSSIPPHPPLPLPPPPGVEAPSRMVTVVSDPSGAQVLDATGRPLCAATPCAVSVPAGRVLQIRLVRNGQSLPATLDGNAPSVRIDLSVLEPPAPSPSTSPPRPAETQGGRRLSGPRRPSSSGSGTPGPSSEHGDMPLFLPH